MSLASLGITPDLTTMGKVIGGGYPVGAVGAHFVPLTCCGEPQSLADDLAGDDDNITIIQ